MSPPPPARPVSSAPGWTETTVRWLRSKHPHLTPASSKRPFPELLTAALVKSGWMRFKDMESSSTAPRRYKELIDAEVADWGAHKHASFREFMDDPDRMPVAISGTGKVIDHGGLEFDDGEETGAGLGLKRIDEEVAAEVDESVSAEPGPKSERSPDRQLDDDVADLAMNLDPRLGAW